MKISARIGVWMCALFALFCFGFAYTGFSALDTLTEEAERELSRGYAWYWMFLCGVAVIFGVLSWLISKGKFGDVD